jgi:purine-nucleoside phosphorylase
MKYRKTNEAAQYLQTNLLGPLKPKVAILTGTGMVGMSNIIANAKKMPYTEIPYFPESTVKSHQGECLVGKYKDTDLIIFSGRFHYYEGYNMEQIVFPIRVMKLLGIEYLIMTNASGGLNEGYNEGDIVMIKDHINLMPRNPLRGKNDDRFGIRFPDMMNAYDKDLRTRISQIMGSSYKEGVYAAMQGPSLETPAEYKMLHTLGADLVGMSTVPEAIAAVHCGLKQAVFSIVSNMCYPPEKLSETNIEDVISTVQKSSADLVEIIKDLIEKL